MKEIRLLIWSSRFKELNSVFTCRSQRIKQMQKKGTFFGDVADYFLNLVCHQQPRCYPYKECGLTTCIFVHPVPFLRVFVFSNQYLYSAPNIFPEKTTVCWYRKLHRWQFNLEKNSRRTHANTTLKIDSLKLSRHSFALIAKKVFAYPIFPSHFPEIVFLGGSPGQQMSLLSQFYGAPENVWQQAPGSSAQV